MGKTVTIVRDVMEANDRRAAKLKDFFKRRNILCLNIMSSPGAGKTSILEHTLEALKDEFKMAAIEGDLQTDNDAQRVAKTGIPAVQVNTAGGCHLDSSMIEDAVAELDLDGVDILFIENVGNLVCPAEFNLGEDHKITMLSVTEGDDKPEKYPLMFHISSVMLLNKIDLLPYVDFSVDAASANARKLNKDIKIFPLSCRTGEGLSAWYDWLRKARAAKG